MLIHKIVQFYRVRKERIQKKIVYKFQLMLRVTNKYFVSQFS